MAENLCIPFASAAHFRAAYQYISEGVFLFHPEQKTIVEGNHSFRESTGLLHQDTLSVQLTSLFADLSDGLTPGALVRAVFKAAGAAVQLQVSAAALGSESLYLCVMQQLPAPVNADLRAAEKALLHNVYHEVKNNLNVIVSLLSLQLYKETDPRVRHLLTINKSRIFTLALLQECLYHTDRIAEVKASEYLQKLSHATMATFKTAGQQLNFTEKIEPCWLSTSVLMPLGLLVHELISNAVLHAFPEESEGRISITLCSGKPGSYELMVQDTGTGLPAGATYASYQTLGSKLIVSLSRQLKAHLQLDSSPEEGTRVTIAFSV